MRITFDLESSTVTTDNTSGAHEFPIGSTEGFSLASAVWLRAGWDAKHVYTFSWLGRPVIQLPEDLMRLQETIVSVRPDVIIETGVAHGGSLVFCASLCKLLGTGRVIGIDIEIRPHNREAIEAHPLGDHITLVEGSSTDPAVVQRVKGMIQPGERTLVLLDSNHTKAHVLAELQSYAPLVSEGSYVVVMDGIMEQVTGAPRTSPDWSWNNPRQAALEFVAGHPEFRAERPPLVFDESEGAIPITYFVDGYLLRLEDSKSSL